jgi:complement resistance protein traT
MDKYSTRVLSIANKVNLDFNEAVPALEDELGRVVGGIF